MHPLQRTQTKASVKHIQVLNLLQWLLMGLDRHVINVIMQTGDKFLTTGNAEIALEFYREARSLFPKAAICCIREAQCHLALVSIGLLWTLTRPKSPKFATKKLAEIYLNR